MKIAHLILAHKNPDQLYREITALTHPAFEFYIHIDKRVAEEPFRNLFKGVEKIHFIRQRVGIEWGGWGTIQATLNGFRVIQQAKFDYINVISGQDFPIKTAEEIYSYYQTYNGFEFITCDTMGEKWKNVESRITRYHLVNWKIPGKYRLESLLNRILPPRKFPLDFEIVGRANWFTLSGLAISYLLSFLEQHPEILRYFKYCWGADEFIFSTILYNSPFKSRIKDNLVFVEWAEDHQGHPNLLRIQDFTKLKNSEKLYARKFDSLADLELLDLLENWLHVSPGRNRQSGIPGPVKNDR